jgi:Flp pilus assembly protein TadD
VFRNSAILGFATVLALCAGASAAIWLSSIAGTCVDEHGRPVAGATLHFADHATGRRFQTKTDAQGRFYYIAVESGTYELGVRRPGGADVTFPAVQIPWSAQTLTVNVDLRKDTVEVTRHTLLPEAYRSEGTPASLDTVSDPLATEINRKLEQAKAYSDRGDWLAAIDPLTSAVKLDPRRDVPQALLGNAFCNAAKQSPKDAALLLEKCVGAYQAAIGVSSQPAYHNNLGTAFATLGHYEDAVAQFRAAEQLSPQGRGLYEQNIAVVLVEEAEHQAEAEVAGLMGEANQALDIVLKAEPDNAEAYYWKGIVLLRLAAAGSANASYRDVAAAFQQYLALAPNGRHAAEINGLLPSVQQMAEPPK